MMQPALAVPLRLQRVANETALVPPARKAQRRLTPHVGSPSRRDSDTPTGTHGGLGTIVPSAMCDAVSDSTELMGSITAATGGEGAACVLAPPGEASRCRAAWAFPPAAAPKRSSLVLSPTRIVIRSALTSTRFPLSPSTSIVMADPATPKNSQKSIQIRLGRVALTSRGRSTSRAARPVRQLRAGREACY
jgi:hypothetical protein